MAIVIRRSSTIVQKAIMGGVAMVVLGIALAIMFRAFGPLALSVVGVLSVWYGLRRKRSGM